jgi:integrase
MTAHPDFPGASSFLDRHGKLRWRYRHRGRTFALPGEPGGAAWVKAYEAALAGERPKPAPIVAMPGRALPKSFAAAWRLVCESMEFQALEPASKANNMRDAQSFLCAEIAPGGGVTWGSAPVADLKRSHVKLMLARHAATPHKARHILIALRKMTLAALDEDWIKSDPCYRIKCSPKIGGHKAWPIEDRDRFEAFWPLGSMPRTVYEAALWLGVRRCDLGVLRRSWRAVRTVRIDGAARQLDSFAVPVKKTGDTLILPVTPMLAEALDAIPLSSSDFYILTRWGAPRSIKALTGAMADWTKAAGIEPGRTLHGLRKSLGKMLAESGATTKEGQKVLGHATLQQNELYGREADQARLAAQGMDKVTVLHLANRHG